MDKLFDAIEDVLALVVFAKNPFVWKFYPVDDTILHTILQISTTSLRLVEQLRVISMRCMWIDCLGQSKTV